MRQLIVILLVLIVSVWVGSEIAAHPGTVLISYRQWVLELPLWLAFLAMVIAFLILYTLLRVFAFFRYVEYRWHEWLYRRRQNKAYDKTHRGLLEMMEEHWASAERHLLQGVDQLKNPVINYLSAAEAAFAQKAYERSDAYLRRASQSSPQDEVVIGLVQAKLQLDQGQTEGALSTLIRLRKRAPHHPAVLRLLEKIYIRQNDWQNLLSLLPYLRKAKVIDANQYYIFEKNVYCQMFDEAERKNLSIHAMRELWQSIPKKIRLHPDVLGRYARLLKADKNSAEEIEPLIRKVLHKEWHDDLGRVYGSLLTSNPARQLSIAESWAKHYGKRAALMLILGRLSLRCQLWGKARHYLEEGLKQGANSETQFELAKLFEQLGDTQLALRHYKNGLELVAG